MLYAIERGYSCRVCRMHVEAASPKNHILYGWPRACPPPQAVVHELARERIDPTLEHAAQLLQPSRDQPVAQSTSSDGASIGGLSASHAALAASEWDQAEVSLWLVVAPTLRSLLARHTSLAARTATHASLVVPQLDEMLGLLRDFAAKPESEQETFVSTARSARQRRLVHFAAEAEGLLHGLAQHWWLGSRWQNGAIAARHHVIHVVCLLMHLIAHSSLC